MSFRELRNFTEIMRNLGYPRLISMENFRTPNFVLVSDILYWLVQRYDQNVDIPDSIATEHDRIVFLKSIAQLVYYKARIKLNIKKLYGADGYAVKELLKIASVLNTATHVASSENDLEEHESAHIRSNKFQDNVKSIRQIASDLTDLGAKLYDLLEEELDLRKQRQSAIAQPHNIDTIKEIISRKNVEAAEMIASLTENIESLRRDDESLREKLKSKGADLVRSRKRLIRLQGFRPAFMDEFEIKEKELQELYTQYVERYRNIEYLENELDKYRKAEAEAIEENKRRLALLRKKMKEEELAIMRGDHHFGETEEESSDSGSEGSDDNEDEDDSEDPDVTRARHQASIRRPRAASGRRPSQVAANKHGSESVSVQQARQSNSATKPNIQKSVQSGRPNQGVPDRRGSMMYVSQSDDGDSDDEDESDEESGDGSSRSTHQHHQQRRGISMMESETEDTSSEDEAGGDYSSSEEDNF